MKTRNKLIFANVVLLSVLALVSCKDIYTEYRQYTANVPQYMSYDDLRKAVKSKPAQTIDSAGKIYIKDNYLFVNERYKGIHVFDNSNPAAPVNLSFIDIPGNVDLAIRGHYLFADSYVDLVVIDIANVNAPIEVARMKDIFPYTVPETSAFYPIAQFDQSKGVITGWKVEEVKEKVEGQQYPYYYWDKAMDVLMVNGAPSSGAGSVQSVGVGGSTARFIINNDKFYGLNQTEMQVIDISQPEEPAAFQKLVLNRNAETVFIEGQYLFIGTQTGMLVYDVSNAGSPKFVSQYNHFQSCDPVVVQDNLAYVTLRSGNRCGNWQNVMEVISLKDMVSPVLLKSYAMNEPYGIGIDNKTLFVCDGAAGLKIYDASDPLLIDEKLLKTYTSLHAFDVIPFGKLLIMIAGDGIYQYDYSDIYNIRQISKIPFNVK